MRSNSKLKRFIIFNDWNPRNQPFTLQPSLFSHIRKLGTWLLLCLIILELKCSSEITITSHRYHITHNINQWNDADNVKVKVKNLYRIKWPAIGFCWKSDQDNPLTRSIGPAEQTKAKNRAREMGKETEKGKSITLFHDGH